MARPSVSFSLALASFLTVSGVASQQPLVTSSRNSNGVTVYNVTWVRGQNYQDILANCGDVVVFNWANSNHDVGLADDGNCDRIASLVPIAPQGSFTITLDSRLQPIREFGEVYFACSVGNGGHCRSGQLLEFYVDCDSANATAPGRAPTNAPARAPGMAPAPAAVAAAG